MHLQNNPTYTLRQYKLKPLVKLKSFRTQLRNIRSFREDRTDNKELIDGVKKRNNVTTKFKVLRKDIGIAMFHDVFINNINDKIRILL